MIDAHGYGKYIRLILDHNALVTKLLFFTLTLNPKKPLQNCKKKQSIALSFLSLTHFFFTLDTERHI